jgi:hypothetical protein
LLTGKSPESRSENSEGPAKNFGLLRRNHANVPVVASPIMKKLFQLPLLLSAVLLLDACSTINSRIKEKEPVYNSLDANTRAKIAHGDVDLGFTPDMVYIALGDPDVKRHIRASKGQAEQWIYRSYYDVYDDIGFAGYGYHRWFAPYGRYGRGYRVYWEPVYQGFYHEMPEDDIRVTFANGKVVMIDQART